MSVKNTLKELISKSLQSVFKINNDDIIIKLNNEGIYTTDIALQLSKKSNNSPTDIAHIINKNLKSNKIIDKIEITSSGNLHILLKKEYLFNNINTILKENKNYGKINNLTKEKINIDFLNYIPHDVLDIYSIINAITCDNLSRIMSFCGYDITKECYILDTNSNLSNLGVNIKNTYKNICQKNQNLKLFFPYQQIVLTTAKNIYNLYQEKKLEEDTEYFQNKGIDYFISIFKQDLDKLRINFDYFTREKTLYDNYQVDEILTKLQYSNYCYIKNNSLYLKTTSFEDSADHILINSDGTYSNLLPSIAHHINKIDKCYSKIIDISDTNYIENLTTLKASISILGQDSHILEIKKIDLSNLNEENIKIITKLIQDSEINQLRYLISSQDLTKDIDLENISKFNHIENINIEINTILKKYKNKNIKIDKYTTLEDNITYTILNKLCEFVDVVKEACQNRNPSLIADYVYQLAMLFNNFYKKENIKTKDEVHTNEIINLLKAIKIVINNSLDLIGIIPKEEK